MLLEVPLMASVAVGGVVVLLAPVLAALGRMAALLAHVKLEIIRTSDGGEGKDPNIEEDRRALETLPPDYQLPPQQEAR